MRVRPLQKEEFKWPNLEEQRKWLKKEEFMNINSEGLVVTMSGKEVIPEEVKSWRPDYAWSHTVAAGILLEICLSVKNYVTVMLQMSSLPCNKGRGEKTSIPVWSSSWNADNWSFAYGLDTHHAAGQQNGFHDFSLESDSERRAHWHDRDHTNA